MFIFVKILFIDILSFGLFLGFFLGFSILRFQLRFSKISSSNRVFQDLSHGVLYFSVAQKFIDFTIVTCFRVLGKYLDLRNREMWKYGMKIWKNTEILLSAMFQERSKLCFNYVEIMKF